MGTTWTPRHPPPPRAALARAKASEAIRGNFWKGSSYNSRQHPGNRQGHEEARTGTSALCLHVKLEIPKGQW